MIMCFRPSSMRLAISISPSRVRSSTEPISRMYMRTGSVVRPNSESSVDTAASAASSSTSSCGSGRRRLRHQQRFGVRRLVVDLDPHVVDHGDDALDLLGVEDVVGQVVVDLGVGEVAALLAEHDQVLQPRLARFGLGRRQLDLAQLDAAVLAAAPCLRRAPSRCGVPTAARRSRRRRASRREPARRPCRSQRWVSFRAAAACDLPAETLGNGLTGALATGLGAGFAVVLATGFTGSFLATGLAALAFGALRFATGFAGLRAAAFGATLRFAGLDAFPLVRRDRRGLARARGPFGAALPWAAP